MYPLMLAPLFRLLILGLSGLLFVAPARAADDQGRDSRRQRMLAAATATLPPAGGPDRTLAPYFFVDGGDRTREVFPLKQSHAAVRVVDSIASVTITQVYRNEGRDALEAVYLFPLSTRAAVHALKMTIGTRVIEARISESQRARDRYEAARTSGRSATLLEQLRPNVAQMNVANVLPGDEVRVELAYAERLVPKERVYELDLPGVVGPRYSKLPASQATSRERWVESPYLPSGAARVHHSSIEVTLDSGLSLSRVQSPTHQAAITFATPHHAQVVVSDAEQRSDRDFILRYQLAGAAIESGAVVEEDGEERFFAVTVEPPARVEPRDIVPREYVFIVDVSGSMSGFPHDVAQRLMARLLAELRPIDRVNVLTFAGASDLLSSASLPATPANVARAERFLDGQHPGGGTELLPALRRALALPRTAGSSRILAVVTDGYVAVESEAFDLVRRSLGEANLFAFGIGTAVNRHLIEGLARAGSGEAFVVTSAAAADAEATRFVDYVRAPVLTEVSVRYEGVSVHDVEPVAIPDVFASRPIVIQGKLGESPRGRVVVTGRSAAGPFSRSIDLGQAQRSSGEVLGRLWARQRIARLSDGGSPSERERSHLAVIALGLKYHLMTEHTSFIAVDSLVRGSGDPRRATQPLLMPEGVSSEGVLGSMASTGSGYGQGGLGVAGQGGGGFGVGAIGHGSGGSAYGRAGGSAVGRRSNQPLVSAEASSVRGGLDPELIRRVVQGHWNELRYLYERALQSAGPGSTLKGRLVLVLTLDATGAVIASAVTDSTLGDAKLEADLAAAARRWRFPASRGGGQTVVHYPVRFRP